MSPENAAAFAFPNVDQYYNSVINDDNKPFWVFGYGSLLWFPDFEADARILGFIDDAKRVMSQASFRLGTESWVGIRYDQVNYLLQPGRVATLLSWPGGRVWGAALKITGVKNKCTVFDKLKKREMDHGYEFCTVMFHPMDGSDPFEAVVYVALSDAPTAIIDVPLEIEAYQIFLAKGPIGENRLYLLKLAKFLEEEILSKRKDAFDPENDLIIQLSNLVKEYENKQREIPESQKHLIKPLLKTRNSAE